jgi:tetratricopeptide (TPR) repeat protein
VIRFTESGFWEAKSAVTRTHSSKPDLPEHLADAIRQAWPDGVIDMPVDMDDAPFWDVYSKLKSSLSRISGTAAIYEREPRGGPQWGQAPDRVEDLPVWDEESRSYHLFFKKVGNYKEAHRILMDLCEADLRCIDAHAHLGNLVFDLLPKDAIRHYAVGLQIGELSLGDGFDGLLPWGYINNRPYLLCMHNYGLCLWRMGRFDEAERVFRRMLWLNPSDNQGARFLLNEVRAGFGWADCYGKKNS